MHQSKTTTMQRNSDDEDKQLLSQAEAEENAADQEYLNEIDKEIDADPELKNFMTKLNEDQDFNAEIERLLANLNGIDLTMLQSEIMLLLKKSVSLLKSQKAKIKLEQLSKSGDDALLQQIHKVSSYIMMQKSRIIRTNNRNLGLNTKSDRYQYNIDKKAEKDLSNTIKRLATYEVYKILNPRRLAGETKIDNFINNIITSGIEFAKKHEKKSDIEQYYSEHGKIIKEAEKKTQQFKGSGGRILMR